MISSKTTEYIEQHRKKKLITFCTGNGNRRDYAHSPANMHAKINNKKRLFADLKKDT